MNIRRSHSPSQPNTLKMTSNRRYQRFFSVYEPKGGNDEH